MFLKTLHTGLVHRTGYTVTASTLSYHARIVDGNPEQLLQTKKLGAHNKEDYKFAEYFKENKRYNE